MRGIDRKKEWLNEGKKGGEEGSDFTAGMRQ
jgi:hypothetical protein